MEPQVATILSTEDITGNWSYQELKRITPLENDIAKQGDLQGEIQGMKYPCVTLIPPFIATWGYPLTEIKQKP